MCVCVCVNHYRASPKKLPSNGEEKHRMPWDKRLMAFATSAYPQAKTKVPSIVTNTQNFCAVQSASIVNNQSEGSGISGSWARQIHRCQQ